MVSRKGIGFAQFRRSRLVGKISVKVSGHSK